MALTPETVEHLRVIYAEEGFSLEKTAERLNLSYADFATRFGPELVPAPRVLAPRRRQPPDVLGQEWCRHLIIAVRHCENPFWPKSAEAAIEDARVKYCAGTHELLTGRDGKWFILYLYPRKTRTGARKFFQVF